MWIELCIALSSSVVSKQPGRCLQNPNEFLRKIGYFLRKFTFLSGKIWEQQIVCGAEIIHCRPLLCSNNWVGHCLCFLIKGLLLL